MIDGLGHHLQAGRVKIFCVNSVTNESWYNKNIHPADRVRFQAAYDATIADIDKGTMGKKKEMIKNEKTDDSNWTIYYTKEAMTDPAKTQYAVDVRKKVGDAEYSCARIEDNEADAKCVMDACLSLKP